MTRLLRRLRYLLQRDRHERELDDELQFHLEMKQRELESRGLDRAAATLAARRSLGNLPLTRDYVRDVWIAPWLDSLARDVRHGLRELRRSKRFTVFAVLTLAVGIGATAAVFAVLDVLVLRPLPYVEPDRLMAFRAVDGRDERQTQLSYPNFIDFRERNRVFDALVSYRGAQFTLTGSVPPVPVAGEIVSWNLFPLLRVQPVLGRGFRPEEEQPGTHVAVLSHALWTSRFGGDEGIPGEPIYLDGTPFTVVGVAPEGFQFPVDAPVVDLWVTLAEDAEATHQRGARMLDVIGRLKPGISVERAGAEMDAIAGALAQEYPDSTGSMAGTSIRPETQRVAGRGRTAVFGLLAAVALVLVIACVNVASLLLARSTERARDFGLQTALGAPRLSLVRQLMIESMTLGLFGAGGGVLLATGALNLIVPLTGDRIPRLAAAGIDSRVLAFSAILAVLTSVLFGLAPALRAASTAPVGAVREGARSVTSGRDRFRGALVVGQIALASMLLVGANLLMSGFATLMRMDPGFRPDHLVTFDITTAEPYTDEQEVALSDRVLEQVAAVPGVETAAAGSPLPLEGHVMRLAFDIETRPAAASERPRSDAAIVSPGYFTAMGIPLVDGRTFTARDDAGTAPVLVVNQAFARRFFPGEEVIGKRIRPGAGLDPVMRDIVGVVGDTRQAALGTDADPIYYFPYKQLPWRIGTIVLRTSVPPASVVSPVREALGTLNENVTMQGLRTGEQLAAAVVAPARFLTALVGAFAGVALLLTVAGLYGVLSYIVARRRRELGVRIALGAGRTAAVGIVSRGAARLLLPGVVLGAAASFFVARLLGGMVFGVPAGLPMVVAGACSAMAVTGLAAAVVPAARAASIDPVQTLRSE